ncbi:MAG: hypothetical protein AB7O24_17895 [Kofleriaceae bacterium]
MMRFAMLVLLVASACGSSDTECDEDEVQVTYLGGDRDEEYACKPRPPTCDDPASCSDQDCIAAMYDYCESPYIGVACSDTFEPPIISCNP